MCMKKDLKVAGESLWYFSVPYPKSYLVLEGQVFVEIA